MDWIITSDYIIGKNNFNEIENNKIACFDLDGTLIKPLNEKQKMSISFDDWDFYCPYIYEKLNNYIKQNYSLIIITNQKMLNSDEKINIFKKKIELFANKLKLSFKILISIKDNIYRKPNTKLWYDFCKGDIKNSFYCGDAGGLPKRNINDIKIMKDFKDTDLKFALNIGLKFIHRDEFIFNVNYSNDYKLSGLSYPIDFNKLNIGNYNYNPYFKNEIILLCGFPASGKSFFSKYIVDTFNYVSINQDTLKTIEKCKFNCESNLKLNKNIIIDNTNLTVATRKNYIDLAKKYNYNIVCIIFNVPLEHCFHNNYFRYLYYSGTLIPKLVYYKMNKSYIKPSDSEGFDKIISLDFVLNFSLKNNYMLYLF